MGGGEKGREGKRGKGGLPVRRFDERSNETSVVLITSARANVKTESLVMSTLSNQWRKREKRRIKEGEGERGGDAVVR